MRLKFTKLISALIAIYAPGFITNATALKNAKLDQEETTIGVSPLLRFYNGTMPATVNDALSGNTLLAVGTLPSDWMSAASAGSKAKTGTWTITGQSGAGGGTNMVFWRLFEGTGTTAYKQGTVGVTVNLTTNALTAANGNVLNFAATTGVVVGMNASGTGVPVGATVVAVGGTTVTLSHTSTAGVANAAAIAFKYDMETDNASIANAQVITVNSFTLTEGN
jgi:hypothetical protein